MRSWVGVLVVSMVVGMVSGCGGDSDSSSQALSKKAFVKQGNAICVEGVKEKDQILDAGLKKLSQTGTEPPKRDVEELILKILPPLEETTEQLGELQPPSGDEKVVNGFMQEWEEALQKAEAEPGSAISPRFLLTPNLKAKEYGLTSCSL